VGVLVFVGVFDGVNVNVGVNVRVGMGVFVLIVGMSSGSGVSMERVARNSSTMPSR
jgi:hypothetical protein